MKVSEFKIRVRYDGSEIKAEMVPDLEKAADKTDDLGRKAKDVESAYKQVSIASGLALAAIIALTGKAIAVNEKLETGVAEISTLLKDVSKEDLVNMRRELLELYVASGQALEPLLKAKYDIVSSGFTDAAASAEVLAVSSDMAIGGITEISRAASLLTTSLNAYSLSANEAKNVSDTWFTTVRLGVTTMPELANSMGRILPTAKAVNLSLDNLGAAIATMTARGLSTAEAVTDLNSALYALSAPTKEAREAMAEAGISARYFEDGSFDLLSTMRQFQGLDLDSIRRIVPEKEASTAIMNLAGGVDILSKNMDEFIDKTGATKEAVVKMSDTLTFKWNQATNALNALVMGGGKAFEPMAKDMLEAIIPIVKNIAEWVDKHPQLTAAIVASITAMTGLTAGMTTLTILLPKVIALITALNVSLGPTGWLVMGLAAVTAGLISYAAFADKAAESTKRLEEIQNRLSQALKMGNVDSLKKLQIDYKVQILNTQTVIDDLEKKKAEWLEVNQKLFKGISLEGSLYLKDINEKIERYKQELKEFEEGKKSAEKALNKLLTPPAPTSESEPFNIPYEDEVKDPGDIDLGLYIPPDIEPWRQYWSDFQSKQTEDERWYAQQRVEITEDEMRRKKEQFASLQASWNVGIQTMMNAEMTGHQRMEAMWKAMTAVALSQISHTTWAYIMGEKTQTAAKAEESVKRIALGTWEFIKTMASAIKSIAAGVYKFYASLGPFAIPASAVTIAAIIAAIKAVKFGEGGYIDEATLAMLGEKGPELVMPEKTFNQDLLPEIRKQIQMQVSVGLQNAGLLTPAAAGGGGSALVPAAPVINEYNIHLDSGLIADEESTKDFLRNALKRAREVEDMK